MKKAALLLFVVAALVIVGVGVAVGSSRARPVATIAGPNNPGHAPHAETTATKQDFGRVRVQDVRTAKFLIKNIGGNPLELTNVSTSCDCTYAYITASGKKSPKFTMHGTTSWVGTVAPQESAELEVIYEPKIMPVQGAVERMVTVTTNDPDHPTIMFTVTADVSE